MFKEICTVDYKTFGQNIRRLRVTQGFRQEDLAEKCGCTASHIGQIENGRVKPSLEMTVRIANPQIVSYDEIPESILVMDDPEEQWIRGMIKPTPYDFEEERLAKAFLELPLKRRRIMELLFLEELSEQETAKRLNCSTGHVRKQRNIALKKLRSQLMKDGDAD